MALDTKKSNIILDKKALRVLLLLGLLITIISLLPILYANQKVNINVLENGIKISGIYGRTIDYTDINDISITSKLPKTKEREKGISSNGTMKGVFVDEKQNEIHIYLDRKHASQIIKVQEKDGTHTYFSLETKEQNQNVYEEIRSKMSE